ncbi:MAG TPA: hypothetical protein VFQ71_10215 [Gaiellales bacterium]|jgi:hypothetical protein|nr:hypothetical protein [Gaiellales bacterium]
MRSPRSFAGWGGVAFAILFFAAMLAGNPPGGNYSASEVAGYVAGGHRTAVFASVYLAIAGAIGMVALVSDLRTRLVPGTAARTFAGCGLVGAAALAIGWCISTTNPLSMTLGGGKALDPRVMYAFSQAGLVVGFAAGGIMLGAALLVLAVNSSGELPTWLRWLTGVAGVLGLASPAFFPFFALLLWSLVIGIWTLTSDSAAAPQTARPAPTFN